MSGALFAVLLLAVLVVVIIAKTARVVPQQSAFVVERLGKYHATLDAGFHILIPFLDVVSYRFGIADPRQHYHLPLKCTPYGYSCFRGGA